MKNAEKTKKQLVEELAAARDDVERLKTEVEDGREVERAWQNQQRSFKIHFDFEEEIAHLQSDQIVGEALGFILERLDIFRVSIALLQDNPRGFQLLEAKKGPDASGTGRFLPFESTILSDVVRKEKPIYREDIGGGGKEYPLDARLAAAGIRSDFLIPLVMEGECIGTLNAVSQRTGGISEEDRGVLTLLASPLAQALWNARLFEEIGSLKRQIELENEYLREELDEVKVFGEIVGRSPALLQTLKQITLVAPTDTNVMILGESGTGKELVAREIHRQSRCRDRPMIKVNCATIPRELYESEFFGHIKGSFTGAIKDRAGRFEAADGGTLFLDEVGEIPLELQSKLLRVLQEGEYERVGEEKTRRVNVRIVAATNRDLKRAVKEKLFREDLYYRLNVFPIEVVPLRQKMEDIPLLAHSFLEKISRQMDRPEPRLSRANVVDLQGYDWPGNVRELQNVLERAVITSRSGALRFDLPVSSRTDGYSENPPIPREPGNGGKILTDAEITRLRRANVHLALQKSNWKIYGPGGAAEILGLRPTTLVARLKKMDLRRQRG